MNSWHSAEIEVRGRHGILYWNFTSIHAPVKAAYTQKIALAQSSGQLQFYWLTAPA